MTVEPGWTIRCDKVVELVTDYLEGQLDEPTRVELEAHLAFCAGCPEYLHQMRVTIHALGHVPLDGLSDPVKKELIRAFRHVPATGTIRSQAAAPRDGDDDPYSGPRQVPRGSSLV